MKTSLTIPGFIWSILSLISSSAMCVAFYIPYWLVGGRICSLQLAKNCTNVSFSSFRRCGYLEVFINVEQAKVICGRYDNYHSIPSIWWQISTVLIGTGAGLLLLMSVITVSAWFTRDILTRTSARVMGLIQILCVLLSLAGIVLFPMGWESDPVKKACSRFSTFYQLGTCKIGWSFWGLIGSCILQLLTCSLAGHAAKSITWTKKQQELSRDYDYLSKTYNEIQKLRRASTKRLKIRKGSLYPPRKKTAVIKLEEPTSDDVDKEAVELEQELQLDPPAGIITTNAQVQETNFSDEAGSDDITVMHKQSIVVPAITIQPRKSIIAKKSLLKSASSHSHSVTPPAIRTRPTLHRQKLSIEPPDILHISV